MHKKNKKHNKDKLKHGNFAKLPYSLPSTEVLHERSHCNTTLESPTCALYEFQSAFFSSLGKH